MRYDDIQGGKLIVRQSKTGALIAVEIGPSLHAVLATAKAAGLLCPYIIARRPTRQNKAKPHPFAVLPSFLSKAVAEARDKTGLFSDYGDGERPTLHELRSLGAHLYREAGTPETAIQALLGHADAKTTEHYLQGHREEFTAARADLKIF